jgi:hypothetical protein
MRHLYECLILCLLVPLVFVDQCPVSQMEQDRHFQGQAISTGTDGHALHMPVPQLQPLAAPAPYYQHQQHPFAYLGGASNFDPTSPPLVIVAAAPLEREVSAVAHHGGSAPAINERMAPLVTPPPAHAFQQQQPAYVHYPYGGAQQGHQLLHPGIVGHGGVPAAQQAGQGRSSSGSGGSTTPHHLQRQQQAEQAEAAAWTSMQLAGDDLAQTAEARLLVEGYSGAEGRGWRSTLVCQNKHVHPCAGTNMFSQALA